MKTINFSPINGLPSFIRNSHRILRCFYAIILLASIAIVIGCNKNDELKISNSQDPHERYLREIFGGSQIQPRFGGKYTVSNALEALNDGLNYLYCRPDNNYLETKVVKDTFSIPVDGSLEIDESDVLDAMGDIALFAGDAYFEDTRDSIEPLMFDINLLPTAPTGYIRVEAIFAWHAGEATTSTDEYPYNDSWVYGQFGGDVSQLCSIEGANIDAADLIRRDLRRNVAYRNKYESYYFRDPHVVCFSPTSNDCIAVEIPEVYFPVDVTIDNGDLINTNDITQNDNIYDYLLFYNYPSFSNYNSCLDDNEMNFYYESMEILLGDILPSPPTTKVLAQIEVGYDLLIGGTIFQSMLGIRADKIVILVEEDETAEVLPCCL